MAELLQRADSDAEEAVFGIFVRWLIGNRFDTARPDPIHVRCFLYLFCLLPDNSFTAGCREHRCPYHLRSLSTSCRSQTQGELQKSGSRNRNQVHPEKVITLQSSRGNLIPLSHHRTCRSAYGGSTSSKIMTFKVIVEATDQTCFGQLFF